jgi:molecular chaperone GrpE
MGELIPVLENLDRALYAASINDDPKGLKEGLELITRQLKEALARHGLTEYSALGELFNPKLHEAVGYVETQDQPPQQVIEEVAKGYRFRDRVLRPALVTVARPPKEEPKSDVKEG